MMKITSGWLVLATLALVVQAGCVHTDPNRVADPWAKAREIVRQISLPEIPDQSFNLADFGGAGDGITDNKPAFDRIVAACTEAGGGKITVGRGTYLVNGPIHLESNMNLQLEAGARLVFGSDPEDYLPVVLTSWEGTRCYNYSPFIYAFQADNVAITGSGEIDGNASESWNNWKSVQDADQELLRSMNNGNVPLEERVFGGGHYLRPHLVQFYQCEKVLVQGVKISDAPFWCLHLVYSKEITVKNLTYEARNFNNDGIDPESCENVLIEEVVFNNRDDNIAIKAGRDLEARTLGIASHNIVIRDCQFMGHNAVAVGSEMSGGVHDVYVEDCRYAGKVNYGFYLKGNRDRGGMVHDIYARNLQFDTATTAIIIDSDYKNEGSCCPPVFKNILVENVRANHATDYGIYLKGSPQVHLDSITIREVYIREAEKEMEIQYMDHLVMERVTINGKSYAFDGAVPGWTRSVSPETGREVWQITSDTAPAVACYFERQAFTANDQYVVYASRSSGEWRLCRMDLGTGVERELTGSSRHIMMDDYTIMPDGERVCYLDGWKLYATRVDDGEEELLFDYTGLLPDIPWYSGSFTNDGRYTLVYVSSDTLKAIYRTDLETGEVVEMHRQREGKISHPLINPVDPGVITYVPGPDTQNDMSLPMDQRARSWKVDLNAGSDAQFLTMPYGFRATHESWSTDGKRFFFFRKTRPGWSPVAICSISKEGGDFRIHYESDTIRLGHGISSRDGRWFLSDSQEPFKNELLLVNLASGEGQVLCWPNSTVDGWDNGMSHVHPTFSPKANFICFTSDRTGIPQVYVVPVGDLTNMNL